MPIISTTPTRPLPPQEIALPDADPGRGAVAAGKRRKRFYLGCLLPFLLLLGLALFPFAWNGWLERRYAAAIYAADEVPAERVAIVFGAAVYRNGRLSPMLQDRVDTAIELYQAGKVARLLFSGDNRDPYYDEPGRMRDYAVARGVPAGVIELDAAGLRTYDTCYRAQHIFGVERAILVTQAFHLPRALFTCDSLGLAVVGVTADRRTYSAASMAWSENREFLARLQALVDVLRREPATILGEPVPLD